MIGADRVGGQRNLDPTLLSEHRGVDERDGVVNENLENTLECRELEHSNILSGSLAEYLDINAHDGVSGQSASDGTKLLGKRQQRLDDLCELAALDVYGVGNELTSEGETH